MKTIGPGRPRGSGWEFGEEILSSFNTLIMPRWFGNLYSSSPYQRQKNHRILFCTGCIRLNHSLESYKSALEIAKTGRLSSDCGI